MNSAVPRAHSARRLASGLLNGQVEVFMLRRVTVIFLGMATASAFACQRSEPSPPAPIAQATPAVDTSAASASPTAYGSPLPQALPSASATPAEPASIFSDWPGGVSPLGTGTPATAPLASPEAAG